MEKNYIPPCSILESMMKFLNALHWTHTHTQQKGFRQKPVSILNKHACMRNDDDDAGIQGKMSTDGRPNEFMAKSFDIK